MASKLIALTVPNDTLYAQVLDTGGNAYNGSGLEPFQDARWTTYAVSLAQVAGAARLYAAPFPAILPAGVYGVLIYRGSRSGPATTDEVVASGRFDWDGTQEVSLASRSTFAGGPVASVTAPVTVGTNADKLGYNLAPTGLDAIQIENGVNARQALTPILASAAGVLLGAGTGTIIVKGGNSSQTRITASTDNAGNRSAVTLTLPN